MQAIHGKWAKLRTISAKQKQDGKADGVFPILIAGHFRGEADAGEKVDG